MHWRAGCHTNAGGGCVWVGGGGGGMWIIKHIKTKGIWCLKCKLQTAVWACLCSIQVQLLTKILTISELVGSG